MSEKISVSPGGEKFPLPNPEDYKTEYENVKKRIEQERIKNREIVVVMGVGFVGAVMADCSRYC
jgi:UDP-N-acetyl-D-glucosamine dehydrogenase